MYVILNWVNVNILYIQCMCSEWECKLLFYLSMTKKYCIFLHSLSFSGRHPDPDTDPGEGDVCSLQCVGGSNWQATRTSS